MAEHSSIEWTDATWNPVTGCSVAGRLRYSQFLEISDCFCELTFGDFIKNSTVRAAA